MIVSTNPDPNIKEFHVLLSNTISQLNNIASEAPEEMAKRGGTSLEPYVRDLMCDLSKNTVFEDSIELVGGQKFPDIIAKKFYGIEVKTTSQNHWKSTGNSVLESTRVEGVERIFMLFAKLANPIEFRYRPYEEVLSEVVVTHSPRYLIDMNLGKGNTIFDKIGISYDELRKKTNPIGSIVDYYKKLLRPGEELWWVDSGDNSKPSNIVIRIWSNISLKEKLELKSRSMIYFPELFGGSNDKFGRLAIWLITREAVVCSNIRDSFTAGGRGSFNVMDRIFINIPRIFLNLFSNINYINELIKETAAVELSEYWGIRTTDERKLLDWIDLVVMYSKEIKNIEHLNIREILGDLLHDIKC